MAAKPLYIEPQIVLLEPNQYKLSKSSVDYLLRTKSPRVQLVPKAGKSDVWQRFSTIRVDGNEVDFCACNQCGGVVTFTKKSGTNGMRTHRCKTKPSDLTNNVTVTVTPTNYSNRTNYIVMPSTPGIRVVNENNNHWPTAVAKSTPKNSGSQTLNSNQFVQWNTQADISSSVPRKKQKKISKIRCDTSAFEVDVDCRFFQPNELTVKAVGDDIVVHAEHDERQDEVGYIKRQFTRRINIPSDVEADKLSSSFSSSGILTIKAPKKRSAELPKERIIPITLNNNVVLSTDISDKSDSEDESAVKSIESEEFIPASSEAIENDEEVSHEEVTLP